MASTDEAAALLAALSDEDRPLWAAAFYGGLRRGELRALRFSDLDIDANVIHVSRSWDDEEGEQSDGKTENAERTVFMVPALRRELIAHKLRSGRDQDDLVFGRSDTDPFVPSTVRRRSLAAWDAAGLRSITLHEARHTWVSICIAAGINPHTVMVAAGHGSYEMTMEHYGKLMPGALDQAAAQFEEYLVASKPGGTTAGQTALGASGR